MSSPTTNQIGLLDGIDLCAELGRLTREVGSQVALAKKLGVSKQFLHGVLSGRKRAPASMLAAMNLRRIERFQRT